MKTVILFGCGEIGSKHLQALLKIKDSLLVQVVARSNASLQLGKDRIKDLSKDKKDIIVEWHNSPDKLKTADLCIVATTATNRLLTDYSVLSEWRITEPAYAVDCTTY